MGSSKNLNSFSSISKNLPFESKSSASSRSNASTAIASSASRLSNASTAIASSASMLSNASTAIASSASRSSNAPTSSRSSNAPTSSSASNAPTSSRSSNASKSSRSPHASKSSRSSNASKSSRSSNAPTSSSASNMFNSSKSTTNKTIDYEDVIKKFNDNTEYGYRWKKLPCNKYTNYSIYGCNNFNYNLTDLMYNNNIIYPCKDTKWDKCNDLNKINKRFYLNYLKEIEKNIKLFPYDQITDNNDIHNNENFKKISTYINNIKKNIFKEVIIIHNKNAYVAYNKLKLYNFIIDDKQELKVELSQNNTMQLVKLGSASNSEYGSIYKAYIGKNEFVAKLSLCDNTSSYNYTVFKQSNLKENHLFELISKYAINKININLPIIYKTLQLNATEEQVCKIFPIFKEKKQVNRYNIGCNLGTKPPINCTIVDVYSGDINIYLNPLQYNEYRTENIPHFYYLLNGFENIIISILSFWSVTKCLHRDTHSGNFLFKNTPMELNNFIKYNIHGKLFYINNLKINWTTWDYGTCMPFVYDNYFIKKTDHDRGYDDFEDDVIKSLYVYCRALLTLSITSDYINKIFAIFHPRRPLIRDELKTLYFIVMYIFHEIFNDTNNDENYNKFFEKIIYYIYNFNDEIRKSIQKPEFAKKLANIKLKYNMDIKTFDFIFNLYNIKDPNLSISTRVQEIYNENVLYSFNNLKKYFVDEILTIIICAKFTNIYSNKKKEYKIYLDKFNNKIKTSYNLTHNVSLLILNIMSKFRENKIFNNENFIANSNNYQVFNTYLDKNDKYLDEYFIGNHYLGYCWIKVDYPIDSNFFTELDDNIMKNTNFISYFENNTDSIITINNLKKENLAAFNFFNTNIDYLINYYIKIKINNKYIYYLPYYDIEHQLYLKLNK